jgi:hypothetical protein
LPWCEYAYSTVLDAQRVFSFALAPFPSDRASLKALPLRFAFIGKVGIQNQVECDAGWRATKRSKF